MVSWPINFRTRNNKKKVYQVTVDRMVTQADMQKLYDGITLEDGFIKADDVDYSNPDDKCEVGIVIHSGKNRIIRRMFEHLAIRLKNSTGVLCRFNQEKPSTGQMALFDGS
jgi:23S rRNA pseudouridine2605 synthase